MSPGRLIFDLISEDGPSACGETSGGGANCEMVPPPERPRTYVGFVARVLAPSEL